jgi:glutathione S-transferase
MAEYTLHCFAQSGMDWNVYPSIRDWLERIRSEPRWVHPYELMPGHPLPVAN